MIDSPTITVPVSIARRLAKSPEIWWPRCRRDSGRRWYAPLVEEEDFEAWLLGWPVGQGIELHDHGSSSGALVVVEGTLTETYVEACDWARPGGMLRHRLLAEGDL